MACADPDFKIPVSVIVATRNEESRIERCLGALSGFDEVIVVDSNSADRTAKLARQCGAQVVPFVWNGQYPKKRQWCLDSLALKHDWVLFVDADEIMTPALAREIAALDFKAAGYFVRGAYVLNGRALRFGLKNNKLALINRRKMMFPVVDDLGAPGMGEIEGHYQPVRKAGCHDPVRQLKSALLHEACDDEAAWTERHQRYAAWEREMNARRAWPSDPVYVRAAMKRVFRAMKLRPLAAFVHCYLLKLGFMDGRRGLKLAKMRYSYYRMI